MEAKPTQPATIDEYIAQAPETVRPILARLREVIHEAAPDAAEKISYQMPSFYQNGMLVWFGAFKRHIGFFPKASGIAAFKEELAGFKGAKGTVQFPVDQPIPYDLIRRIVKFRVAENLQKTR